MRSSTPDPRSRRRLEDTKKEESGPRLLQLVSPSEPLGASAPAAPFIGREGELKELRAALESAQASQGRLILLFGEPGIGKTRLAEELATYARSRDVLVLWGRCWEGGGAGEYWPWVQVVRACLGDAKPAELRRALGSGAARLAGIVPEIRELLGPLPQAPISLTSDPERARFALFDTTTGFLRNVAATRPLVILLDDLHAADPSSLLLLRFLGRALRELPILVVGTYREADAHRTPKIGRILGDLAPDSQGLALRSLTESEVGRFLEESTGIPRTDPIVADLHCTTGGNPFFVRELVRALAAKGRLDPSGSPTLEGFRVPDRLRQAIRRRLEPLSPVCRAVLNVAAVMGNEFEVSVLERVPGLGADDLGLCLTEAADEGIASPAEVPGAYRFTHSLIRETLYEDTAPARRAALHHQIAYALEARHAGNLEPHLAALAHHFHQAASKSDAERALHYAARAGERALSLIAYEDAAARFECALQALAKLPTADEVRRLELLLSLGEAQRKAGDFRASRQTLLEAANLARGLAEPEMLARAALGFPPAFTAAELDDERVRLLEEALEAMGEADSATRSRLLARLAWELYWSDSLGHRARLSAQAVEIARRIGDPAALAYALDARCLALWGPDHMDTRLADASEMLNMAQVSGDLELAAQGHRWRIQALMELGDVATLDREIAAHASDCAQLGQPLFLWWLALWRTMRALLAGRFEDAERLAAEARVTGERLGGPSANDAFRGQMLLLLREEGRIEPLVEGFEEWARQRPRLVEQYPGLRYVLASLYSMAGREAEARREFEYFAVDDFQRVPRYMDWFAGIYCLAETCAFLGDRKRASTLYELLLPYAGRVVVTGPVTGCFGLTSRALGLLAATMRRWEEAETHFEDALRLSERMQSPPFAARIQQDYASMLVARGSPGDASKALELAEQALATARHLGMVLVARDAEELCRGIGRAGAGPGKAAPGVAPSGADTGATGEACVFRQEGQYWTIAYEGDVVRLRDTKGLRYLAHLLRYPDREFHVVDLVAALDPGAMSGEGLAADASTGPVLDASARSDYRRRLAELREELEEAEQFNDLYRATRLREEMESILGHLAAATGLGRRPRRGPSDAERARVAVTKRIKASIRRISDAHSSLGYHLATSVRTGNFCAYRPPPGQHVSWAG